MADIKLFDTDEKEKTASEVLENADTGSSIPETIRNTILDIGAGGAMGAIAGGIGAKISSKAPAKKASSEAIKQLKEGVDDSLGHQKTIITKGTSHDPEVRKMMEQNKKVAQDLFEGGNSKKALKTVVKNSKREAEIGPRLIKDIQVILQNDTGLSEKQVKNAINDFIKENANDADLIKLLEAKDPIATYSHSLGVQDLTFRLAKKLGLNDKQAKKLSDAALVHDIGKIQVPDSIINSAGWFGEYPNLKKWMLDHDIEGSNILQSDPFKAKVAKGHHPLRELSDGSQEEGIVTVADVYEALTSKKRSYKTPKSKEGAIQTIGDDVRDGIQQQDYLDLIKALDEDGLLPNYYDYKSPLEEPYKAMKANAIKKQVETDYGKKLFGDKIKKYGPVSMALGAGASGALEPTSLPSLSEIISEISPSFKTKAEKLDDIKRWYRNGFTNDEIDDLIVSTDFSDNKQITKLWKLMKEQFRD